MSYLEESATVTVDATCYDRYDLPVARANSYTQRKLDTLIADTPIHSCQLCKQNFQTDYPLSMYLNYRMFLFCSSECRKEFRRYLSDVKRKAIQVFLSELSKAEYKFNTEK